MTHINKYNKIKQKNIFKKINTKRTKNYCKINSTEIYKKKLKFTGTRYATAFFSVSTVPCQRVVSLCGDADLPFVERPLHTARMQTVYSLQKKKSKVLRKC